MPRFFTCLIDINMATEQPDDIGLLPNEKVKIAQKLGSKASVSLQQKPISASFQTFHIHFGFSLTVYHSLSLV